MTRASDVTRASYEAIAGRYGQQHPGSSNPFKILSPRLKIAGADVLDVGCGTGRDAREFAAAGATVVGIDYAHEMVRLARDQVADATFTVSDIRDFATARRFDIIWSNAVLHHLCESELDNVFCKLFGLLRPGGVLCVIARADLKNAFDSEYEGAPRLYHGHGQDIYARKAVNAGFAPNYSSTSNRTGKHWIFLMLQRNAR